VVKDVNLACVPEAVEGDYVIVHVGLAISVMDEKEALRVFEYLEQMDEIKDSSERTGKP
jgi:hydrogenase expression/formation protein HypC